MILVANANHIPLADDSVQCVVTSPPYWGLRDYGVKGQLGLEATPEEYVESVVSIFREIRRVLKSDGVVWLNLGDSYAGNRGYQVPDSKHVDVGNSAKSSVPEGLKPKDLIGIPWRVALALQADGWWLRSDIIWAKPNPMPESIKDRCTSSHEHIFMLTKSARYYYDADAIREKTGNEGYVRKASGDLSKYGDTDTIKNKGSQHSNHHEMSNHPNGRNKRSVWTITTKPYPGAHYAVFPEEIPRTCILASSRPGDVILDPFAGSGTTGKVAIELGRKAVCMDISEDYAKNHMKKRMQTTMGLPFTP